jgi:formylglycine-generating enzyme required for sulfatase activity
MVAPAVGLSGVTVTLTVRPSVPGRRYQLQYSDSLVSGTWANVEAERVGDGNNLVITTPYDPAVPQRYYWLVLDPTPPSPPDGFALIPAGSFQMGDPLFDYNFWQDTPVHAVQVSAFYMGKHEVTNALWAEVREWGLIHGYTDLSPGGFWKPANHPVTFISWYEIVKWCNARSEQDGRTPCYTVAGAIYRTGDADAVVCDWSANGDRLPTEAEWEKAARGGLAGRRFPWGDTISHSEANYFSNPVDPFQTYDTNPTHGLHSAYDEGNEPYTAPVGSFAPNGFGLHDMSGNISEWCWDRYSVAYYATSPAMDPRGADTGGGRVYRGGHWTASANGCRVAFRYYNTPTDIYIYQGFRTARSAVPWQD